LFPCRIIIAYNGNLLLHLFGSLGPDVKTGIIYTGSFGPLQKFVVELLNKDKRIFAYAKIGIHKYAQEAILKEELALVTLGSFPLQVLKVPQVIQCSLPGHIRQQMIIVKSLIGGEPIIYLSESVIQGLIELSSLSKTKEVPLLSYVGMQIKALKKIKCIKLSKALIRIQLFFIQLLESLLLKPYTFLMLPMAMSHGDFTRWNIRADKYNVFAIDWEEFANRPLGHDIFTFLFTEKLFVEGLSPEETSSFFVKLYKDHTPSPINHYFADIAPRFVDKKLFLILFFIEIARYNLWHAYRHKKDLYPEKRNLFDAALTAEISCRKLMGIV